MLNVPLTVTSTLLIYKVVTTPQASAIDFYFSQVQNFEMYK